MLYYITKPLFFVVLFCIAPHYVVAKDKTPKTTIGPTTCYLGVDVAKTCVGWYQKTGPAYEVNGSIDFGPILWDVDYGFGQIQRDGRQQKGSFSVANGYYFRLGLGYNFLTPTFHHNQFFIGFRYARSFFDFQLKSDKLQCNHPADSPCLPTCVAPIPALQHVAGSGIAHWWEIVAGGKVYLISILSIGCTARYKFSKKIENKRYVLPFDVPGFGLNESDHAFGYSVYILARIPLQKSKRLSGNFSKKSVT